jgi:hypothetical protein
MRKIQYCLECGKNCKMLSRHLRNHHNLTSEEYYIKYNKNDGDGICKCCNAKCRWDERMYKYNTFCSMSCRAKILSVGRSWSEINKRKQSLNKLEYYKSDKGLIHKQRMSENRQGENNPVHKQSIETRQKMSINNSEKMKLHILNGTFTPPVTNSWAKSRCVLPNCELKFRSTWEACFFILNKDFVEYEKLRIPYIDELGRHKIYIVDFIDRQNNKVYEIKPTNLKSNIRNILKEDALISWCKTHDYTYISINDEYFRENASKIDYSNLDTKIKRGMKQFL